MTLVLLRVYRQPRHSLCRGIGPVVRPRNGKRCCVFDISRDDHGLIPREDGLAERHDAAGFIHGLDRACTIDAVGLVLKRLLCLPIVAVKSAVLHKRRQLSGLEIARSSNTYHGLWVGILGAWFPLRHHLARHASNRAIVAVIARLVRAHSKPVVVLARDVDEIGMIRQRAGGLPRYNIGGIGHLFHLMGVVVPMAMPLRIFNMCVSMTEAGGNWLSGEQHRSRADSGLKC